MLEERRGGRGRGSAGPAVVAESFLTCRDAGFCGSSFGSWVTGAAGIGGMGGILSSGIVGDLGSSSGVWTPLLRAGVSGVVIDFPVNECLLADFDVSGRDGAGVVLRASANGK
jgi:hypothetical protein